MSVPYLREAELAGDNEKMIRFVRAFIWETATRM
jgi:hypothetical protein